MPAKSSDIALPSVCVFVSIHKATDHVRKLGSRLTSLISTDLQENYILNAAQCWVEDI